MVLSFRSGRSKDAYPDEDEDQSRKHAAAVSNGTDSESWPKKV